VNSVASSLTPFPPLWINEVQADNLTGITNRAGQHAPWLELFNPTTNTVPLNGLYLANNYSNLTAWAFPADAVMNPGEFKVIFADGQVGLSTPTELHASFALTSGSGSVALSRPYQGLPQVLDYIDYADLAPNCSFGSAPDGQSFYRQVFFYATPGASNNAVIPPSFIPYTDAGAVYSQQFDSLPAAGQTSVNSDNPVVINGITYSLANPFDFAFPPSPAGSNGGLGLPGLAGWYGWASASAKFGATDGDQTTGGVISFGLPGRSNRALGLLATSSTSATAFGAKFINQTTDTLNCINLQFTGQVWRQANLPKTLQCFYLIDPSATAPFSMNSTAALPELCVNIPTVPADIGGVAVDGTLAINQTNIGVVQRVITNWPPGAALWLVWEMADTTGKAQGLAIDNLSFSATAQSILTPVPLTIQVFSATNLVISWPAPAGQSYQLEFKDDLASGAWTALGAPYLGTGVPFVLTNDTTLATQRFYRLRMLP
jgi:hypothetical protein